MVCHDDGRCGADTGQPGLGPDLDLECSDDSDYVCDICTSNGGCSDGLVCVEGVCRQWTGNRQCVLPTLRLSFRRWSDYWYLVGYDI